MGSKARKGGVFLDGSRLFRSFLIGCLSAPRAPDGLLPGLCLLPALGAASPGGVPSFLWIGLRERRTGSKGVSHGLAAEKEARALSPYPV